jgi:ribosomal protein S18 acetylase RimI-like enzyme
VPDSVMRVAFGVDPVEADQEREEVANFDCGDEPWSLEVSRWLRAVDPQDCVWSDLQYPGARVWLYYNQSGELVGVGALGHNTWTIVRKQSKEPITILTNFAVSKAHQHKPKGDGEVTYGKQIMRDLRAEAEKDRERRLLCLCVHPDNPIKDWYQKQGFYLIEPPQTKTGHYRMALDLQSPVEI